MSSDRPTWISIPKVFNEADRVVIGQAFDAAQVDWKCKPVPRFFLEGDYQVHEYEISFAASDRKRALKIVAEFFGYSNASELIPLDGPCPSCDAMLDRAWQCPSCELNFGQVQGDDPMTRFLIEHKALDAR